MKPFALPLCAELGPPRHPSASRYSTSWEKVDPSTSSAAALAEGCGNIPWRRIEALLVDLGAEVSERKGSRIGVRLFGDRRVFHRPHPSPNTDAGAVASIRDWLRRNGVEP